MAPGLKCSLGSGSICTVTCGNRGCPSPILDIPSLTDMSILTPVSLMCMPARAGQHVEQLHRYLAQQGYMKARRKPSRYFDEATSSAVATWQQDHGVVPSGSFGHESRQAYLMQLVKDLTRSRCHESPCGLST